MWDIDPILIKGVMSTILGLLLLANVFVELAFAADSLDWPIVQGEIDETGVLSSLSRRTVVFAPQVRYHYRVDDEQYFGDRIAFGGRVSISIRAWAAHVADRYRGSKQLEVRVSPKDPRVSVLEPGWHWSFVPGLAIGAIFLGVGVRIVLTYVGVLGK